MYDKRKPQGYSLMLISICIPVFNMADTIERAIVSALNQDYKNIEVIVVDNQSNDDTYRIASAFSDKRLTVIRNETNLGAYGNHNRCLAVSQGVWVKFLHGDDELLQNCISTMVKAVEICPDDLALIGCGAVDYSYTERESSRTFLPDRLYVMKQSSVTDFMLEGNIFGTPSMVMIHREKLLKIGGFDLEMEPAGDGDCWIALRRLYSSAIVPYHLVIIRDDPPEDSAKRGRQLKKFCTQIFRQIDKWHNTDRNHQVKELRKTPYAEWLCIESFRYWDAAFKYALVGRIGVMSVIVRELYSRNMLFRSLLFYIRGRLGGRNSKTFRGNS